MQKQVSESTAQLAPLDTALGLAIGGKEAPVPAGLFWTDANGHGTGEIKLAKQLAWVDKFAVEVEPATGVLSPTGTMILIGQ